MASFSQVNILKQLFFDMTLTLTGFFCQDNRKGELQNKTGNNWTKKTPTMTFLICEINNK